MIHKKMRHLFLILLAAALMTGLTTTSIFAATYYVATTGSDSNPGTLAAPFKTIQKGIDVLKAGDTCYVRGGTYNEGLVLKQSGTSSAPITIRNYNGETVTVNSGNVQAVRTGGRRHYNTIDGLRFISRKVTYSNGKQYSLDFEDGVWDGFTDKNGGNNGFILRNCYIEGSVHFYGHYNLMENCEVNGRSEWSDGIFESFAASHHNTYRKNKIYGFTNRGIWSMQYTDSVTIENNVIHDTGNMGIDCDGAGHPVYNSVVRGNIIYNVGGRGIEMENAFNSITKNNVIYNSAKWGINYINYGYGPDFNSDDEYRDDNTNALIRNNLIYNTAEAGIILNASPGVKIYNNTIYKNYPTKGYFAGIALCAYGGFPCINTDIQNNIIAESDAYAVWVEGPSLQLKGLIMKNNLYYHTTKTKTHYFKGIGSYTLAEYKTASGIEQNSLFANPRFTDVARSNFRLTDASPAKDAGAALPAVVTDLEGVARPQGGKYDIGAYEISGGGGITLSAPKNLRVLD